MFSRTPARKPQSDGTASVLTTLSSPKLLSSFELSIFDREPPKVYDGPPKRHLRFVTPADGTGTSPVDGAVQSSQPSVRSQPIAKSRSRSSSPTHKKRHQQDEEDSADQKFLSLVYPKSIFGNPRKDDILPDLTEESQLATETLMEQHELILKSRDFPVTRESHQDNVAIGSKLNAGLGHSKWLEMEAKAKEAKEQAERLALYGEAGVQDTRDIDENGLIISQRAFRTKLRTAGSNQGIVHREAKYLKSGTLEYDEEGAAELKTILSQSRPTTNQCGRVQFSDVHNDEDDIPKDLLCEECSTAPAVLHCEECHETYCLRCADLCHPRVSILDPQHPHEVSGSLRPLKAGDRSRITTSNTIPQFWLPPTEVSFEDYESTVNKHLDEYHAVGSVNTDLTLPNSLTTGAEACYRIVDNRIRQENLFGVHDLVLFQCLENNVEAVGQVISQWDETHGGLPSVPPMIRGERSHVYYIIRTLGRLSEVDNLSSLASELIREEGTDHITAQSAQEQKLIESLSSAPYRETQKLAREINKRIQELRNLQAFGPKYHLRPVAAPSTLATVVVRDRVEAPDGTVSYNTIRRDVIGESVSITTTSIAAPGASVIEDQSILKSEVASVDGMSVIPMSTGSVITGKSVTFNALEEGQLITNSHISSESLKTPQLHPNHPSNEAAVVSALINRFQKVPKDIYDNLDTALYNNINTDASHFNQLTNADIFPLPASLRSFEDVIFSEEGKLKSHNLDSRSPRLNPANDILVLSEEELRPIQEKLDFFSRRKALITSDALEKIDTALLIVEIRRRWKRWKRFVLLERKEEILRAVLKIQTCARVWLCRNVLTEKDAEWTRWYLDQRQLVHKKFKYTDPETSKYCYTVDGKNFFTTHAEVTHHSLFTRLMVNRVIYYLTRYRISILRLTWKRWQGVVANFTIGPSTGNQVSNTFQFSIAASAALTHAKREIVRSHRDLLSLETLLSQGSVVDGDGREEMERLRKKHFSDESYERLLALPLRPKKFSIETPEETNKASSNSPVTARRKFALPLSNLPANSEVVQMTYRSTNSAEVAINAAAIFTTNILSVVSKSNPIQESESCQPNLRNSRRTINTIHSIEDSVGRSRTASEDSCSDVNSSHLTTPYARSRTNSAVSMVPSQLSIPRKAAEDADILAFDHLIPAYDPSCALPLPELVPLSDGRSFRERLYKSVATGFVPPPLKIRSEVGEVPNANSSETNKYRTSQPSGGNNIFAFPGRKETKEHPALGPTAESYWMIPNLLLVGNIPIKGNEDDNDFKEEDRTEAMRQLHTNYRQQVLAAYRQEQEAKFGPVKRVMKDINPSISITPAYKDTLNTEGGNGDKPTVDVNKSDSDIEDDTNAPVPTTSKQKKKPLLNNLSKLSAVGTLLMLGTNTFISLLTAEEEAALLVRCSAKIYNINEDEEELPPHAFTTVFEYERYLEKRRIASSGSIHSATSMRERINSELGSIKSMVMSLIQEYQTLILKQEEALEKIPQFGPTDPRFKAAKRERERRNARIELSRSSIERLQVQVRFLPQEINFYRLPLAYDETPWSADQILAAVFQIERLIQLTRVQTVGLSSSTRRLTRPLKLYMYGGGYAKDGDGPTRDGLIGLLSTALLGRLYSLHPLEAIRRWQEAHDTMRILRNTTKYPHAVSVPPLPWQKTVLMELLKTIHLPIEKPIMRAQHNPEVFTVHSSHPYNDETPPTLEELYEKHGMVDSMEEIDRKYLAIKNSEKVNYNNSVKLRSSVTNKSFTTDHKGSLLIKANENSALVVRPNVTETDAFGKAVFGEYHQYFPGRMMDEFTIPGTDRIKQTLYFSES